MFFNMSGKKRDIVKGCTACGKTCGGFDEVRTRFVYYLTHLYLFFIGEQAGFDDNFEYMTRAGSLYGFYLGEQVVISLILEPADIDNHINLVRAVFYCVLCFKAFRCRCGITVGKADNRAYGNLIADIFLCTRNI